MGESWTDGCNIKLFCFYLFTQYSQHNGSDDHQNCLKSKIVMSVRKLLPGLTWMKSVQMTAASPPATVKTQAMASKMRMER